ncbi:MAG: hypothetical protein K2H29_11345 [Oscillospiraceae bacterium]|nr:hypothetical protein [Oscillospiraceae bacterium]
MIRKQVIKRKVVFLLAVCMVSNFSMTVCAEDTLSNIGENSKETMETLLPDGDAMKWNAPEAETNDLKPISKKTAEATICKAKHSCTIKG